MVALAARCGTTTVARALAAELARRDPAAVAVVWHPASAGGRGLAAPAVGRLAAPAVGRLGQTLAGFAGDETRAVGHLCLVDAGDPAPLAAAARYMAPLVLEVPHGEPAGRPAALADHVVLVAGPRVEPALADAVAASLARVGTEPLIAVNRVLDPGRWAGRGAVLLPESRTGARLALAGREARGQLGASIAELADLCEAP